MDFAFDWDQANIVHVARHNVTPAEIEMVFANNPIDVNYDVVENEERWTLIGHTDTMRVLIVVFALRNESIRPITAYEATKKTAREYLRGRLKTMPTKAERIKVPKFATEAEEAKWWDDHQEMVEGNLLQAMKDGTARRGTAERLVREARESKNITIRMPVAEIERARELAEKKGLGYQTYMKMLLREALDKESRKAR